VERDAVTTGTRLDALREALREALRDLDTEHLLGRHEIDRIVTAAVGLLHREQDAARDRNAKWRERRSA
jgi:hypothetical protein